VAVSAEAGRFYETSWEAESSRRGGRGVEWGRSGFRGDIARNLPVSAGWCEEGWESLSSPAFLLTMFVCYIRYK
jgi:hypothetical protein